MKADALLHNSLVRAREESKMVSLEKVLKGASLRRITPQALGGYTGVYVDFVKAQFCALFNGAQNFEEVATRFTTEHNEIMTYALRVASRKRKAPRPERRS